MPTKINLTCDDKQRTGDGLYACPHYIKMDCVNAIPDCTIKPKMFTCNYYERPAPDQ